MSLLLLSLHFVVVLGLMLWVEICKEEVFGVLIVDVFSGAMQKTKTKFEFIN
jgi:hypothetical protein